MFISLPTGFGKSIIHSILPLCCLKKLCPSINTFHSYNSFNIFNGRSNIKFESVLYCYTKIWPVLPWWKMCKFFCSPESLLSSPKPQMEEALIVDSVGEQLADRGVGTCSKLGGRERGSKSGLHILYLISHLVHLLP